MTPYRDAAPRPRPPTRPHLGRPPWWPLQREYEVEAFLVLVLVLAAALSGLVR